MDEMTSTVDLTLIESLLKTNNTILGSIDLSNLETALAQNNYLLQQLNTSLLFIIGVAGASMVLFLLYKFLRKFF